MDLRSELHLQVDSCYEELIVQQLHNDRIGEDQFSVVWEKPGMLVGDSRLSEDPTQMVSFRVPAKLTDLDKAIEAGKRGEEFAETNSRSILWSFFVFFVLLERLRSSSLENIDQ